MSPLFSKLHEERGSAVVMAGVIGLACILLGGSVIEVGQWLSHRRHVQVRADAAALAGGQTLAQCFNLGINGVTEASVDQAVENTAKDYGGITSTKNLQTSDTGTGETTLVSFNGSKYPDQAGVTKDLGNECSNLTLDVKMAETGIPRFLSFSPLETVHGWARVQLQQIQSLTPTLPFAIPDVRVNVAVTFVNNATGAALPNCPNGCVFKLTGPTLLPSGLNGFSTNATVPQAAWPAANTLVGMRVALGNSPGSCAAGANPTTYKCFDDNTNNGLVALRSYAATTCGANCPILQKVTPTTCSGTPFFSDFHTTTEACSYGVTATVDWGSTGPPPGAKVRATVNGTNLTLARSGSTNIWVSTNAVTLNTVKGPYPVTMSWCVGTCAGKNSFTKFNGGNPVQQIFSGSDSPIEAASVLDSNTADSSYSFLAGQAAHLAVSVGLSTGVHLPTRCSNGTSGGSYTCATDPSEVLRNPLASGGNDSLTFAIDCGNGNLRSNIELGCAHGYSINVPDICPDPANPNPPDCATSQTGAATGQLRQGMNYRFTVNHDSKTRLPNNYPNYPPGDPRAVTLIITDWNAWLGKSGNTDVPVVTFATFYVTGWDGATNSCTNGANPPNEPEPAAANKNSSIWGHYIADVNLGGIPNGQVCLGPGQLPGFTPCAIALTR